MRPQVRTSIWESFLYVGLSFAAVVMVIYLQTLIERILQGTTVGTFLYTQVGYGFPVPEFWERIVTAHNAIQNTVLSFLTGWLHASLSTNMFLLVRGVAVSALVEEVEWRGITRLFQGSSKKFWWWVLAAILLLGYTLSYYTGPMNLLVVLTLGAAATILVKVTGRLWTAILLHILINIKGF